MTSREFCYWLQGFFELQGASSQGAQGVVEPLTTAQTQCIQNHLNMVFKHEIDPSAGSAAHQAELSALHEEQIPEGQGSAVTKPISHFGPHTVLRC